MTTKEYTLLRNMASEYEQQYRSAPNGSAEQAEAGIKMAAINHAIEKLIDLKIDESQEALKRMQEIARDLENRPPFVHSAQ